MTDQTTTSLTLAQRQRKQLEAKTVQAAFLSGLLVKVRTKSLDIVKTPEQRSDFQYFLRGMPSQLLPEHVRESTLTDIIAAAAVIGLSADELFAG